MFSITLKRQCAAIVAAAIGLSFLSVGVAHGADLGKVEPATQRARDEDRQHILQDELRDELARLTKAEAALSAAQASHAPDAEVNDKEADVARSKANVDALRREIAMAANAPAATAKATPVKLALRASSPTPNKEKGAAEKESVVAIPWWDTYARAKANRN
jgi:hypothetical protein